MLSVWAFNRDWITKGASAGGVRLDQVTNNTEFLNKSAGDRFKSCSALQRTTKELRYVSTLCLADSASRSRRVGVIES
ncbi:hypothetical protein J6590_056012 [Homalodisca vitripennis]|nr:hypothetical protein J6590_056012 [Homalodisca vitripennis]